MRQKGILLGLVEAVHLIDKHDGVALLQSVARSLCLFHRLADVLDAPQHRADGDELRIKCVCHQPCYGGFAYARRTPQDAAVRLARLERQAQGHALPQQMLLANDLTQRAWAQQFGQRLVLGRQSHGLPTTYWRITSAPAGGLN